MPRGAAPIIITGPAATSAMANRLSEFMSVDVTVPVTSIIPMPLLPNYCPKSRAAAAAVGRKSQN